MSQTYISAKEPYIAVPETTRRKIAAWTLAVAAAPMLYIFTNESYISTKEPYIPTQELHVLHKRDVYLRK